MKKFSRICGILLAASVILTGCAQNSAPAESDAAKSVAPSPVTVNIAALNGPTGMGLAEFITSAQNGEITDNDYQFKLEASSDAITTQLVNEGGLDIAAVPANLASVLYNNTDGEIQTLAINTLGVLYIVENGDTINSVEDLRGKTIYASGKGLTPEYTLDYILSENGINPDTDVTIEWKSEHAECLSALMQSENGIAMLPQPFVTTAQTKAPDMRVALDLNNEWDNLQADTENPSALITGVVVARKDFVDENPSAVNAFLDHYADSVEYVTHNITEAAEMIGALEIVPANVAEKAIPECNITFIEGDEMKGLLSGYLGVLYEQNAQTIGGNLPDDDFYYSRYE